MNHSVPYLALLRDRLKKSDLELEDLFPPGVNSFEELKKLYEEKRYQKQNSHKDFIKRADHGSFDCAIFSPDDKFIVSGSSDGSITIFNTEAKKEVQHIEGTRLEGIRALAMTFDGKYLVSRSDLCIQVFEYTSNPKTSFKLKFPHPEEHPIILLDIETDKYIAYICDLEEQRSLKLISFENKGLLTRDYPLSERIQSIKMASSRFAVLLTENGSIKILSLQRLEHIGEYFTYPAETFGNMTSIATKRSKSNHQQIVAGCSDGSVKILNLLFPEQQKCLRCDADQQGRGPVKQVVLSDDGEYVCAGFRDGSLVRWNLGDDNERTPLQRKGYEWDQIAHSKNADFLIACSEGQQSARIIDIGSKEANVICLEGSQGGERYKKISFAISQDSKYIISATQSGVIKFFDSETKQEVVEKSFSVEGTISEMIFTPNKERIIVLFEDGALKTYDFKNGTPRYDFGNIFGDNPSGIVVTANSQFVIAISNKTSIKTFDMIAKEKEKDREQEEAERQEIEEEKKQDKGKVKVNELNNVHKKEISCITTTPDNKFIVSASHDKSIKMFEIATNKDILADIKDYHIQGKVYSVAVTSHNKFILAAFDDLSIKIFDMETKQQEHAFLYTSDDKITTLSISPNNRYVASGSKACSVRIYDIDMQIKLLVHRLDDLHDKGVKKVTFAPNNKYLVSLSDDGSLKFINFEIKMEANQIQECQNLSQRIWKTSNLVQGRICEGTKDQVPIIQGEEEIESVAVSFDNQFIICGTKQGSIQVYNMKQSQILEDFSSQYLKTQSAVTGVAMTFDNQFLAFGCQDRFFKVFNWRERRASLPYLEVLKIDHNPLIPNQDPFYSIAPVPVPVPGPQFLILSTGDQSIQILDIRDMRDTRDTPDRQQIYLKNVHHCRINCIAVSYSGEFFASCSDDRCLKIFDFKTTELVHCFEKVHQDPISIVTFSQDDRFLISGSSNQSIKVFDIRTRQRMHHFHDVHTDDVCFKDIKTTPDSRYIVTTFSDNSIKMWKLIPTSPLFSPPINQAENNENNENKQNILDQESYFVYNRTLHHPIFNAIDNFFFDPQTKPHNVHRMGSRWQNLTIYPYGWNVLHLAVITQHEVFLNNMPEYTELKVPFLLDAYSKTPLHYLVAYEKLDLKLTNYMVSYICDYLDDLDQYRERYEDQPYEFQEIIISLRHLFWFLLTKPDVKIRARFFDIASTALPTPFQEHLPKFGKIKSHIGHFCPKREFIYHSMKAMHEKGEDQISFRANFFELDYDVLSLDMKTTIKCLSQQKDEDIFKTALIIDLIDYLWHQVKATLFIKFIFFSGFLIALSVYLSRHGGDKDYENSILSISAFYVFCEVLQGISIKKDYFKDLWNFFDIIFYPLIIGYITAFPSGLKGKWLSSLILLLGYLRWISNLRIFKPTRSLIRVILTVVWDMWSFLVIIAALIICFSFIFLVFNRGHLYGFYLYNSYSSLYGLAEVEGSKPSELVFIALIAFLLNVILLNLLISIMADSRTKVLQKRIKTDSLTRLEMISEAAPTLRFFRFICLDKIGSLILKYLRKIGEGVCSLYESCLKCFQGKSCSPCLRAKSREKGFLIRCQPLSSTYNEDDEEGTINRFKKLLKESNDSAKDKLKKLQDGLEKIEVSTKVHKEKFEKKSVEFEKTRKDYDDKIDQILAILTERKQKSE